jgi:hypothetical protein
MSFRGINPQQEVRTAVPRGENLQLSHHLVRQNWPRFKLFAGGPTLAPFHWISSLIWWCLLGVAPIFGCPVPFHSGHRLQIPANGNLAVPYARTVTMQCQAFSAISRTTWNGHPLSAAQGRSFPLGLDRERLWVEVLKGPYINYDRLILPKILYLKCLISGNCSVEWTWSV